MYDQGSVGNKPEEMDHSGKQVTMNLDFRFIGNLAAMMKDRKSKDQI